MGECKFKNYKNKKIALYGLGAETEKVLPEAEQYCDVVGLLDGFKEEGELFDKPIISMEQALNLGIELIIVVARPGSCKAIAKRIGDVCREHGIALMDIRGNDLLVSQKVVYDFSEIHGVTKAELMEQIKAHEVISFDLFDTLIMRQTLEPTDVIEYVAKRALEKGLLRENIATIRLGSEKELSKYKAPTLEEIYGDVVTKCEAENAVARELAELEWKLDYELCVPRLEVCEVLKQAYNDGKKIYIVSDSYYRKDQLQLLLEKCGIADYTDVLVSCEYGIAKGQGLYHVLRNKEKNPSILHIGDDEVADIECAQKEGIDTCRLYNGRDLMQFVGYLGLEDDIKQLSDRLKVGMFVARLFNSPFQFETVDRKLQIQTAYDIGYLLCAPLISDFIIWFYKEIKEKKIQNIWFSARDGYLIQKMYRHLSKDNHDVYFHTSRTAAIRAGVENDEDIAYVDSMRYFGSIEDQLAHRFGIQLEKKNTHEISASRHLIDYKEEILRSAADARHRYQKYISKLEVCEGPIVFFDFVAKGTTQIFVQRLIPNALQGMYFLHLEPEYMRKRNQTVESFYTVDETADSVIFENYYFLETILTAPHASVCGFDAEGNPVYVGETRSKEDIDCVLQMQEGIFEFFQTYVGYGSDMQINKALDEKLLSLMHKITIDSQSFRDLVVEDPFFNRMTPIKDIIN